MGELCLSHGPALSRSTHQELFMDFFTRKADVRRSTSAPGRNQMLSNLSPVFLEAIDRMRLPNPDLGPTVVVEFGSSGSKDSIDNVRTILRRLKGRYDEEIGTEREYQVFFQDLPTTDFNMLIRLLNSSMTSAEDAEAVKYFAGAVAGSSYGRLFPHSSLHFAFSTFALNCLSRIPESVTEKSSPAYNGGRTGLHRSNPATMEAYSSQAREDLRSFLAARADEMADDGVLCLNFRCREAENSLPYSTAHEIVGDLIWDDFVDKGIISASKRDSFNPLQYWRTVQEVKDVLSNFNCEFHLQTQLEQQLHMPAGGAHDNSALLDQSRPLSKGVSAVCSGVPRAMIKAHFGREVTNLYLERYEQVLMERIGANALSKYQSTSWFVVVLIRKARLSSS